LNVDAAARFENYSDFGSTLNGKLAVRYEFVKNYAIRAAVGQVSEHHLFNSSILTILMQIFPLQEIQLLPKEFLKRQRSCKSTWFDKLKQETSVNGSAGFTLKPIKSYSIL
jgi:iron complex outermembrane receptor protein